MRVLENKTITDIAGILSSGIASGIKGDGKKDLCVIYSKYKAVAAGVFTTNKLINSGNANSKSYIQNPWRMQESVPGR